MEKKSVLNDSDRTVRNVTIICLDPCQLCVQHFGIPCESRVAVTLQANTRFIKAELDKPKDGQD